jgi:hypothetical protein
MKSIFLIVSGSLLMIVLTSCNHVPEIAGKPRVFVFTDINIDAGDPDDRQSLVHILWYADELDITGIVPDRWNARGLEACQLAVEAYSHDYRNYHFGEKGFPAPAHVESLLAVDREDAFAKFQAAASVKESPLYVLIWGNMQLFGEALRRYPEVADNIRVVSIGTGVMLEEYNQYLPDDWEKMDQPCKQYNWNGWGRQQIFDDSRFSNMWWLEINWTYDGMFTGPEPEEMFYKLSKFGDLGQHMIDVTENEPWARYFRVGDTPSVLYVIDPENNLDDPTRGSWAGRFSHPFPDSRPNFYTDHNGDIEWDYENPCNTWSNHTLVHRHATSTLEKVRPAMYEALLQKLTLLYE